MSARVKKKWIRSMFSYVNPLKFKIRFLYHDRNFGKSPKKSEFTKSHTHTHTHTHTERKWRKLAPVGAGGEYRRRSDWHPAPTACCVRERLGGRRRQFVVICRRRARVAPARDCCGGGGRQLDARLIKSMVNLNYNWKWNHFNQLDNVQL